MGDRGNIVIQERRGKRVYFYTHWRGSEIRDVVKTALERRQRWNDHSYLARIVFCTLIAGDTDGETGFGISTGICDNSHPILVLDVPSQNVFFEDSKGKRTQTWGATFEEVANPAFVWPDEEDHGEE